MFSINPNVGFNVSDNWSAGFGLYGVYSNDHIVKAWECGGILFAQNFSKITDWFYYTPRIYINIGGGTVELTDSWYRNTEDTFFNIGVGASLLGFEFKVAPKTGVTLDLGGIALNYVKIRNAEGNIQIDLNAFQKAQIGMRFHF